MRHYVSRMQDQLGRNANKEQLRRLRLDISLTIKQIRNKLKLNLISLINDNIKS